MATSGAFNTTGYQGRYLQFEWRRVAVDTAGNTSTIEWTLTGRGTAQATWYMTGDVAVEILGVRRFTQAARFRLTNGMLVASGRVVIPHRADGTMDFGAYVHAAIYTFAINSHGESRFALDPIPRASTFTLSPASITCDGTASTTVNITRFVPTWTHDVRFAIGTYSHTVNNVATSTAFAPPREWINAIPNAERGACTVTVTTRNGNTVIGSRSATLTLAVPADVVPTIDDLVFTRINNRVPAGWNEYVQNQSGVTATLAGAAGTMGSTIQARQIRGGVMLGAPFMTDTATLTVQQLPHAGSVPFTATVTDSRGRTASLTKNITVQAWQPPGIGTSTVDRALVNGTLDDNGTYLRVNATTTTSSINNRNVITRSVQFRRVGVSSWTSSGTFTSGTVVTTGANAINTDYAYQVQLIVTDSFESAVRTYEIPTGYTTVDYRAGGRGMAIGKVSERDGLELAMQTTTVQPIRFVDQFGASQSRGFAPGLCLSSANPAGSMDIHNNTTTGQLIAGNTYRVPLNAATINTGTFVELEQVAARTHRRILRSGVYRVRGCMLVENLTAGGAAGNFVYACLETGSPTTVPVGSSNNGTITRYAIAANNASGYVDLAFDTIVAITAPQSIINLAVLFNPVGQSGTIATPRINLASNYTNLVIEPVYFT